MEENKSCRRCSQSFVIAKDDLSFYEDISPQFAGGLVPIPPPTLCPDCRLQRRFAFRNERRLYRRKSCLSDTEMITTFSPTSPYKVCTYEEWWSDKWDPLVSGKDYDPKTPFFDQLKELSLSIPHCPLYIRNAQNSDYTNYALNVKDCYLAFGTTDCELVLYGKTIAQSREIVDSLTVTKSELCYEGIASERCYQCMFFSNCVGCNDCIMVDACESCNHCALCFGLYRKEYCILNEFVGKERYEEFIKNLYPITREKIKDLYEQLNTLADTLPHRESYIIQSENCSGNNISQSKNCFWCFDILNCEDCKYLFWTPKGMRSQDCCYNSPDGVELCYEVCSTLGSRCMGTFMCWNNDATYYSIECHNNRDILGCVGLRHKQYCILNKQYSKDDYEKLALKITEELVQRGEWGQYLPERLALFPYNDTIAQEYFPLEPKLARMLGFKWQEEESPSTTPSRKVIPKTIDSVDESITSEVLHCEHTNRPFKILPSELSFYKKMKLPLPTLCPDERHKIRLSKRTPLTLWKRSCAQSGKDIWTSYPPHDLTIVYSNDAYKEYLYT